MDFTLKKYSRLCHAVAGSKYRTATVGAVIRSLEAIDLNDSIIILRHDVDRFPRQAVKLAQVEHSFGLVGSYYFRIPASFNRSAIASIGDMGHEVGLHYECLDKANGDIDRASDIFAADLQMIRRLSEVKTVSMHGNPFTRFDNREYWYHHDFSNFDLDGEVYLSMNFQKMMYYSDTGRTWEDGRYNIKDVIPADMETIRDKPVLRTTDDLIELISAHSRNIYLLIHPERWASTFCGWMVGYMKDLVLNKAKVLHKHTLAKRS
jgi:hypothetical protein